LTMFRPLQFLCLLAVLAASMGGLVFRQRQVTVALREQLGWQRRLAGDDAREKAKHAELVAKQLPPEEVARRREEREAWVALAAEIDTLRGRIETRKTAPASAAPDQPRSIKNLPLPAGEWRNAGQETPVAAFETVLWAAAGGEVAKLAEGLEIDDATKSAAAAIFDRLPPALRREVGTPEQLVALLTARDVPLGSAWILGQFDDGAESKVIAQLANPEGEKRELTFALRAHDGRWRMVVPPQVMTKYTAFLRGKPAEAAH